LKSKSACKVLGYIFTLCISEFYFGYTLIYLSAIDFNTIITEYSITMEPSVAEGIFQGIVPIGGAIGAFSSALILSRLSRKYQLVNSGNVFYSLALWVQFCVF
jgi:TRAP-type C4-dicarboxylate transport system permease small subunit